MTRILIPSYLRDIHAGAVAEALRGKGHEPVVWHGADFPTRQTSSMFFSDDGTVRWEVDGPELEISSKKPFDAVWFRRPVLDPLLPEDLHSGDRVVAEREGSEYTRGLWKFIARDAFWVNPLGSQSRSTVKALQLSEAAALGLKIPPTLFSNNPAEIRRFLQAFPGETIYKPFFSAVWKTEDTTAHLFTASIGLEDLPEDEILRLTPGIFQKRISKAYELRITCMGDFAVAAKLLSQQDPEWQLDWRAAFTRLPVEPIEISPELHRACRRLMEKLGIVFGCFDLMVTPEGDCYFLEVNEMGQFLWIEEINPDIRLLDPFCEFLIQARPDFTWQPSSRALGFLDVRDEAIRRQDEHDAHLHLDKLYRHAVDDRAEAETSDR
jgi:glutathione synthase/RimK-type ligase-like ATP-grasp enzyme